MNSHVESVLSEKAKLSPAVKELVAVGASAVANCQSCVQYHVGMAKNAGAKIEEIAEAVEIAKSVRAGAASKTDKFASSLLETEDLESESTVGTCGCGCS
jgi:AhpD family alkylhydroperoxidase